MVTDRIQPEPTKQVPPEKFMSDSRTALVLTEWLTETHQRFSFPYPFE